MKILIIEDEESFREGLRKLLERKGHECTLLEYGEKITGMDNLVQYDAAIIDYRFGEKQWSGAETGRQIKKQAPDVKLIMLTAYDKSESIKEDALSVPFLHFIGKPFNDIELDQILESLNPSIADLDIQKLSISKLAKDNNILGNSPAHKKVLKAVEQYADTPSTVMITGESGTGKEKIARLIHQKSGCSGVFIAVNCSSIPKETIESLLFGHEKGAFTGAIKQHLGYFETAHNGTIFLDEIGDMPSDLQAKLLRVLQEREFIRLGSSKTIKANFRLITATHQNLENMIENDAFREDLFYRISVLRIDLPPLRERKDDIMELANFFINKFKRSRGDSRNFTFDKDSEEILIKHEWPGNIRELEHLIERSYYTLNSAATVIHPHNLCFPKKSNISTKGRNKVFETPKNLPAIPESSQQDLSVEEANNNNGMQSYEEHEASKLQPVTTIFPVNIGDNSLTLKEAATLIHIILDHLHPTLAGSNGQIMELANAIEELKEDVWNKAFDKPEYKCIKKAKDKSKLVIDFLYGLDKFIDNDDIPVSKKEGIQPKTPEEKMDDKASNLANQFKKIRKMQEEQTGNDKIMLRYPDFISFKKVHETRGTDGNKKKDKDDKETKYAL